MPHRLTEIRCTTFKFEASNCVIRKIWVTKHPYLFSLFYLCTSLEIISSLIHLWYCGIYGCCSYLGLSFHMKHREIVERSSIIMACVPVGFWIALYERLSSWNLFFYDCPYIYADEKKGSTPEHLRLSKYWMQLRFQLMYRQRRPVKMNKKLL